MQNAAVAIPEKLFFKIGEVCELTGVQAHVLRYWESEFSMLSPQKNRAGQRTYRRRDVEIALRIRELLYEEMYTIAGARKRLGSDLRGASRLKVVTPEMTGAVELDPEIAPITHISPAVAAARADAAIEPGVAEPVVAAQHHAALRNIATELRSLLELLDDRVGDR